VLTTRIERIIAKGQLVPIVVSQTATASQTNVEILPGTAMPFAGEIVAVTYKLTNNKTAGTLAVGPTVDGTEVSALTVSAANSTSSGQKVVKRRTSPFAAGAVIGAEVTTDGSFAAGTTPTLTVTVWVILSIEGV
jgi:hypothetical protein